MPLKELVFLGNLEPGKNYRIDIVINDRNSQKSTTTINLHKTTEIKRPLRINYTNKSGILVKMKLYYDEATGNMTALDYKFASGVNYYHEFSYNDMGLVDTLTYRSYASDGTFTSEKKAYYNFIPGTDMLNSIETQSFTYENGEIVGEGSKNTDYQNFVYDERGAIVSFYKTQTVTDIYYSDPFNLGEIVFGEYWQSMSYQASSLLKRQHREDYDPVLIPTYIEGFSPIAVVNPTTQDIFNDLFWHKYMMTKTVPTSDAYTGTYLRQPSFNYETDNEGNITKITKIFLDGGYSYEGLSETYNFFYE